MHWAGRGAGQQCDCDVTYCGAKTLLDVLYIVSLSFVGPPVPVTSFTILELFGVTICTVSICGHQTQKYVLMMSHCMSSLALRFGDLQQKVMCS